MKSHFLINVLLCLMLLFGQHVTLAESVTAAQYSNGDHQCALEDSATSDADIGAHIALDEVVCAFVVLFQFPASTLVLHRDATQFVVSFYSVVSPHYATRAPPAA
jgi:hypothetical protein